MADQHHQHDKGGPCTRLLHYYSSHRDRPRDNAVNFWQRVVREFFAPDAVFRIADARANTSRTQGQGQGASAVPPPGDPGLEAHYAVLPHLLSVKYSNGLEEESLYMGGIIETRHGAPGFHTLESNHAIEHSRFATVSIFRKGKLRVVFDQKMFIVHFNFEVHDVQRALHSPIVTRHLDVFQSVVDAQMEKMKENFNDTNRESKEKNLQHMQEGFQAIADAVRRARNEIEYQSLNIVDNYGHMRRFMRCIQVADTVSSMQDLFDATGPGGSPMETLETYGRLGGGMSTRPPQEGQNPPGSPMAFPSQDPTGHAFGNLMGSSGLHRSNPTPATGPRRMASPAPSLLDRLSPNQEPMGLLTPAQANPVNQRLGGDGQPPFKRPRLNGGPNGLGAQLLGSQLRASAVDHLTNLRNGGDLSSLAGSLNPSTLAQLMNGENFNRSSLGLGGGSSLGLGGLSATPLSQLTGSLSGSLPLNFLNNLSSSGNGLNGMGEAGPDLLRGNRALSSLGNGLNGINGMNGLSSRSEALYGALQASDTARTNRLLSSVMNGVKNEPGFDAAQGTQGLSPAGNNRDMVNEILEALQRQGPMSSPRNGMTGLTSDEIAALQARRMLASSGTNGMSEQLTNALRGARGLSSSGNGINGLNGLAGLNGMSGLNGLSSLNGMGETLPEGFRGRNGMSSLNGMGETLPEGFRGSRGLESPRESNQTLANNALLSNLASHLQSSMANNGGDLAGTPDYGLAQRRQQGMSPTLPRDDRG